MRGQIPNVSHAGVVLLPDGHLAALDHLSMFKNGPTIELLPAARSDVDRETGIIINEGAVALLSEDGRGWVERLLIDPKKHPWNIEELRRRGIPVFASLEGLAVGGLSSLNFPGQAGEIDEIDERSGKVVLKPRRHYL